MAEKLSMAKQAVLRSEAYDAAITALANIGYTSEVVKKGAVITKDGEQYLRIQISYCNPDKFNLDGERAEYANVLNKRAERAEKSAQKAKEKAEKAEKAINKDIE